MKSGLNMKNGLIWMVLAVAALVSTNAWAVSVWNPDTDAALVFNMNFENYSNADHNTVDAKANLNGTLADYNETNFNVFGETSAAGLGLDANFAEIHDLASGKGVPEGNDVKLKVPSSTGVFDLGLPASKHTWAFWFNAPRLEGSIIRHASINLADDAYRNKLWEIRITAAGVMEFNHRDNCLKMETALPLSDLGVDVNTWHHAAIVIDRSNSIETSTPTTRLSTKIYIDGLEVPVIVTSLNTSTMNVDAFYDSPLWIGAGDREFDGLLDDVRLFSRALTATEVSILNQADKTQPIALAPIPRSSNVVISTGLSWSPAPGATTQAVYFGTDVDNLAVIAGAGSDNRTNAELGGQLALNTTYYWYIKTNGTSNGPLWSFNTETGKAILEDPLDGAEDANVNFVDVNWYTPTPATYTVYLSQDRSLVEANSVSAQVAGGVGITANHVIATTGSRGAVYYWRVNSTYGGAGTIPGDIWSFRTDPYEIVFNTSGNDITYADHVVPAYNCAIHGNTWSDSISIGSLRSDGVVQFDFTGFNYDRRYDIVVIPQYRATDINDYIFPTPIDINVTGDFYFDGRVQIAGDDVTISGQDITFARSGGYPGPKHNNGGPGGSVFNDRTVTVTDYWTQYLYQPGDDSVIMHGRVSDVHSGSAHYIQVPTALAQSTFGPGQPVNPPYKGGGGGGYGGLGGDSGRG